MLLHLKIKNFATIKELEVDFGSGFSILTGETGAGKSILIDAIMLLRGDRGRSTLVRSGEDQAEGEAVLSLKGTEEPRRLLEESGIIERHDFKEGKSRYEPSTDAVSYTHLQPTRPY